MSNCERVSQTAESENWFQGFRRMFETRVPPKFCGRSSCSRWDIPNEAIMGYIYIYIYIIIYIYILCIYIYIHSIYIIYNIYVCVCVCVLHDSPGTIIGGTVVPHPWTAQVSSHQSRRLPPAVSQGCDARGAQ